MVISIFGWYGTETLGDRAILDGILSVFGSMSSNYTFQVGSLFPFFTERTLYEEERKYNQSIKMANVSVFDVKDRKTRRRMVLNSDLVVLGGGPLMDLEEMFILEDVFRHAYKNNILSIVMGCGIGPLYDDVFRKTLKSILGVCNLAIFRDAFSLEYANMIMGEENKFINLGDPAIISLEEYANKNHTSCEDYVSINLREYPQKEYGANCILNGRMLRELISDFSDAYEHIYLVPMHTFDIGGDDRVYMKKVIGRHWNNVEFVDKPYNLLQLYENYSKASACVGMRYHSIVMQTVLNGNNIAFNYTEERKGKINGFFDSLAQSEFYSDRVYNVVDNNCVINSSFITNQLKKNERYNYMYSDMKSRYKVAISKLLNEASISL